MVRSLLRRVSFCFLFQLLKSKSTTVVFIFSFIFCSISLAEYKIPSSLNSTDQKRITEILGYSSSTKMNFSPDPLGGYQGFQFSLSQDFVNMKGLKSVGLSTSDIDYFQTTQLALGKGLYYDVDIFFVITPPQEQDYNAYGGLVRWRFKEYSTLGLSLGLSLQASGSEIASSFGSKNTGVDLYSYWGNQKIKILFGIGQVRTISKFVGGTQGLTQSATSQSEDSLVDISSSHLWGTFTYVFSPWSLTLGYDQYVDENLSVRLGYSW